MDPLVEMRGIRKRFGQVEALRGVDLELRAGEVHALVGENGAGKSTLIKVLAGLLRPDAGSVAIDGADTSLSSRADARRLGLSFVFQELAPLPHFSAAEYMSLGQPYARRAGMLVDWRALRSRAEAVGERLGIDFPLSAPMRTLSIAQQRLVEIGQGLVHRARLLVLDEPTASLSDREVMRLFQVVDQLRLEGVTVLYVSHRLEEVFRLADRVTVLRDGGRVATRAIADTGHDALVRDIVGDERLVPREPHERRPGKVVLEAHGVATRAVSDVSLTLRAGEIVGLAGLVGSGRTEVARALFGVDRLRRGRVLVNGQAVTVRSPRRAIRLGIGLLPEERKTEALLARMPIRVNVTVSSLDRYTRAGFISRRRERAATERHRSTLGIRMPGPEAPMTSLSGGNQQKVVLARLLESGSRILILDEPTKGVDIGAKKEMFGVIRELAGGGAAVLYISSDHDELCEVCDRAIVMREGQVAGELAGDALDRQSILALSYGRRA